MNHEANFARQYQAPIETAIEDERIKFPEVKPNVERVTHLIERVDDIQPLDTGFYPRPPTGFGVELPESVQQKPMHYQNEPMPIEDEPVKQEQDYSPNSRTSMGYSHGNSSSQMQQCVSEECLRRQIDEFKQEEFTPAQQNQTIEQFNVASLPCTFSTQAPISTQASNQNLGVNNGQASQILLPADEPSSLGVSQTNFPITSCQNTPITQSSQQIIIINQNPSQIIESNRIVDPNQNTQVVNSVNKVTMSSGADLLQQEPPQQAQQHNQQVQPVYERTQTVQDVWQQSGHVQQPSPQQQQQILPQPTSVHNTSMAQNNYFGDTGNTTSSPTVKGSPYQQLSPGNTSNTFQQAPTTNNSMNQSHNNINHNQMVSQSQVLQSENNLMNQQFQQSAPNLQHPAQNMNNSIHMLSGESIMSNNQITNQLVTTPVQAQTHTFMARLSDETNFKNNNEQNSQTITDGKGIIESLSTSGHQPNHQLPKESPSPFDIGQETSVLPDLSEFRHIPPKIDNPPEPTVVVANQQTTSGQFEHSVNVFNASNAIGNNWDSIGHPLGDQDVKMRDMSVDGRSDAAPVVVSSPKGDSGAIQNGTRELTEEELRKLIRDNPDISIRTTVEPQRVIYIFRNSFFCIMQSNTDLFRTASKTILSIALLSNINESTLLTVTNHLL